MKQPPRQRPVKDERDEQIQIGVVEDVLRRAHAAQDERAEQRRDNGDDHRHDRRQTQPGPHVAAHRDIIVRAELLRDGNAETSATPRAKAQYQEDDRAAGSHRSQRVDTQKFAHDGRIDQRISLLKQIAQQQGQREVKDERKRRALRQFFRSSH